MKILEISEADTLPLENASTSLRFHFDDAATAMGAIAVPAYTRTLLSRFDRHVLNRVMAQKILRDRPDVVYVKGLTGCTLDLPRVARLLGLPVCLEIEFLPDPATLDPRTKIAVASMLASVDVLITNGQQVDTLSFGTEPHQVGSVADGLAVLAHRKPGPVNILERDYALYEFSLRDHPLLVTMQRQYLTQFHGCSNVLDLGCGAGIFLEMLADAGIDAMGIERSPLIAEYARGMGMAVETADALDFLRNDDRKFDGIYCSHFIEHLPFEVVRELLARMATALSPGGVLVLVFPDPESIRSQLFGFWRDPEHVRFYHPELIELLGISLGLVCEWQSSFDQPHEIVSYPAKVGSEAWPASVPPIPRFHSNAVPTRWWWRVLGKMGLGPRSTSRRTQAELTQLRQECVALADAVQAQALALNNARLQVDRLWSINQTWAWQDNAALRFRKPLSR